MNTLKTTPWWLSPFWAFLLSTIPVAVCAIFLEERQYLENWRVHKFVDAEAATILFGAIAAYVVGHWIGMFTYSRTPNRNSPNLSSLASNYRDSQVLANVLWSWFKVGMILTVFGYVVWIVSAVQHGVSLSLAVGAFTGAPPDSIYVLRAKAETVPGLSTCVQFGMATATLGSILLVSGYGPLVKKSLIWLVILSALRAFFNSERLALLEVIVPLFVIIFAFHPRLRRSKALALLPIAAGLVVFFFFALCESFRSWTNYYEKSDESLLMFAAMRIWGYYITAVNNGALAWHEMGQSTFPVYSLFWLWHFPGLGAIAPHCTDYVVSRFDLYSMYLVQEARVELNNLSGIFAFAMDFGMRGVLVFWVAAGFTVARLYRSFTSGAFTGVLLYPLVYVGLLEISRIPYWTAHRAFPSWVMLFVILGRIQCLKRTTTFYSPVGAEGIQREPAAPAPTGTKELMA